MIKKSEVNVKNSKEVDEMLQLVLNKYKKPEALAEHFKGECSPVESGEKPIKEVEAKDLGVENENRKSRRSRKDKSK